VLDSNEELDAKQKFDDFVNKSQQFTIDPNELSANASQNCSEIYQETSNI
jgi:hypothetical protein